MQVALGCARSSAGAARSRATRHRHRRVSGSHARPSAHAVDETHPAHRPERRSQTALSAGQVALAVHSTHRPMATSHTGPAAKPAPFTLDRPSTQRRRTGSQTKFSLGHGSSSSTQVSRHRSVVASHRSAAACRSHRCRGKHVARLHPRALIARADRTKTALFGFVKATRRSRWGRHRALRAMPSPRVPMPPSTEPCPTWAAHPQREVRAGAPA